MRKFLLLAFAISIGALAFRGGSSVHAAVNCPDGSVRPSAGTYAECNLPADVKESDFFDSLKNVINVILGLLGVAAVVVIILGGFTFMTSQGDAGKVMKGRNTILWGVVGLVVALLAFAIVNFVLNGAFGGAASGAPSNDGPGNQITPSGDNEGPGNQITPGGDNEGPGNQITPGIYL